MKTSTIVGVIVALIVLTGIIFYVGQSSSPQVAVSPAPTTEASATPAPVVQTPGLPTIATSAQTAPTDTTVVVTGTVTPNGSVTDYWYEYGPTPALGKRTAGEIIGSGYSAVPAPNYITGLTKDTVYYFRLVAQNEFGTVTGGQYSFVTTHGNPPPVGSIPTIQTVAASDVSRTVAILNANITPNSAETSFWFEYGTTKNLGSVTTFADAGGGSGRVQGTRTLSDLQPLTTYYFRVDAQNQFGTVNGSILSFKTTGPAAPSAPTVSTRSATNVKSTTVTLRGTVNPNNGDTGYWFEYSTDSLLGDLLVLDTNKTDVGSGNIQVSVSADVSGLATSTTYYYRTVAENSVGGIIRGEKMSFKTSK